MNWQSEAYASLPSVQQLTNVRFLSLTSLAIFLAADASASIPTVSLSLPIVLTSY